MNLLSIPLPIDILILIDQYLCGDEWGGCQLDNGVEWSEEV